MGRKRSRSRSAGTRAGGPSAGLAGEVSVSPSASALPLPPARRWRRIAALAFLFLVGVALGFREIDSPDIGFHLSTARWMIEERAFPRTDPLSYTVTDRPSIDLQWAFQLWAYSVHRIAGAAGLVGGTTALTLAFAGLLLLRAHRRDGRLPHSAAVLLLLFFLGNLWEPRPHLLSWIWGSAVLLILEEHGRGSRRGLPWLPVVMALWVNSHSLYVLGLVILGVHALWAIHRWNPAARALAGWSAAAAAACLLNPYSVRGLLFPLTQFGDIQGASGFKSTLTGIAEFTTPFSVAGYFTDGRFVLLQPLLYWQLYAVLAVAALAVGWKRVRLTEAVLIAAFFYLFWRANKNFGYFVMVSFPAAASALDGLGARLRKGLSPCRLFSRWGDIHRPWGVAGLAAWSIVNLLLIALTLTGRLYDMAWTPQRPGASFSKALLPVEACAFLNRHAIEGRLLNSWNQGGYIAWATRQPVFVYSHGEIMGAAFYREYVAARQPGGFEAALRKWEPTVAIVPYRDVPYWLYSLSRDDAWRRVYADEHTAIFLHRTVAPGIPAMPRPAPGRDYPVFDVPAAEGLIRAAASARRPHLLEWARGRAAYPVAEMAQSSFHLQAGELDAGLGIALEGVRRTPFVVPDLLLNLGHVLEARRHHDLADVCYDAFIRTDGDAAIVQEISGIRRLRRPPETGVDSDDS